MFANRFSIQQLRDWIELRFDRSAGPGGQNVNKVNTRATLLFDFQRCPLLIAEQKARLRTILARRVARDGRLRVVSQQRRTQIANRLLAERRLVELLRDALKAPRPRRATKPTPGSRARRLSSKRRRATRKRERRTRPEDGD